MRILFNNLIYSSTLTADTVNANYPLTNLQNDSIKKIYKSTTTGAVITATMSSVGSINCAYMGYTNATAATLAMYSSGNVLLGTVALDVTKGGKSFTTVSSVSYVKLTLAGSDTVYLGGFGFGLNYKMPNPTNDLVLKPIDNSTRNYSDDGQLYINRVNILHQLDVTYSLESIDTYNAIMAKWEALIHPAWVEPYEENTGMINPMFCDITMDDSPTQSWKYYTWAHNYREVR